MTRLAVNTPHIISTYDYYGSQGSVMEFIANFRLEVRSYWSHKQTCLCVVELEGIMG